MVKASYNRVIGILVLHGSLGVFGFSSGSLGEREKQAKVDCDISMCMLCTNITLTDTLTKSGCSEEKIKRGI